MLLLKIVNTALERGLPVAWKRANITMIPKKSSGTSCPSDYRTISLTSCVGKLCERIVKNRLYAYLEEHRLIINEQSGFRNKRGTGDNLLFVTQKISEWLKRGKKACGILFDISKAFDKVWHAGLIYKLINLKVPHYLIKFVKNFLTGRSFTVNVNGKASGSYPISCGVPQGSVLGPILFLVFIGDIPLSLSKRRSYSLLFADDLCVFYLFNKDTKQLSNHIRAYLQSLVDWLFK